MKPLPYNTLSSNNVAEVVTADIMWTVHQRHLANSGSKDRWGTAKKKKKAEKTGTFQ